MRPAAAAHPEPPADDEPARDRFAVARLLREAAGLLDVQGERFRSRAYERAAQALESVREDLGRLIAEGRLQHLPGVGARLAAAIAEAHRSGRFAALDQLRRELPPGVLELREVPGLTLRRIHALHRALGVDGVAALEAAGAAGRLRGVRGFGEKTERALLEGLARRREGAARLLLPQARAAGRLALEHVRSHAGVERASWAGELRRQTESVGRIDVVAAAREPAAAREHFLRYPPLQGAAREASAVTGRLSSGVGVRLEAVSPERYAAAMTRRIVGMLRLPVFKIWGHPLGRLIGRRPPLACRMEEVLDAAADARAAIEINGDPHRLDLEPGWARAARERGLRFVVSTDAHSVQELGNAAYGVAMARRAWLERRDVLNALPLEAFHEAVRP